MTPANRRCCALTRYICDNFLSESNTAGTVCR